ncbi:GcrA family cell cycle regulator [Bosea sp. TWI1241]|uniref:GcrA family cell cycle regulator n=1 Tax=Bosea sp. TWI1241 TaxID=3148904 RepID=UPI00320B36F7
MTCLTIWTEEEDDFLRRALAGGASYADIASDLDAVFGTGRSKNALIGRARRKGFAEPRRTSPRPNVTVAKPKRPLSAGKATRPARPSGSPLPSPSPAEPKRRRREGDFRPARTLDPLFDAAEAERTAEIAAFEAKVDANGGLNPGVRFLERDPTKHCAAWMPGWDAAAIGEKRVCGAPVEWRRVQRAGITELQPTSWCEAHRKRFTVAATERRADLSALANLDKPARRAA